MAGLDPLWPFLHGHPLKTDDVDLAALAARIGHRFTRAELALEALTHRGTLDRRADLKDAFPHGNERLEFLGDRVLSLAMADLLLRYYPQEREGEIARRHANLVSARTIAEVGADIGIAGLRVSHQDEPVATSIILSDMMEALLGAVYRDAGFEAAAAVIERLWGERIASGLSGQRPPKTALQEWAQGRGMPLPDYREVSREGAAHQPVFLVEVKVGKYGPAQGRGPTKRDAESAAADALLKEIAKS